MRFKVRTPVKASCESVWRQFDRDLFLQLAPPFPRMRLLRFDGCRKGDKVHIELNFLLFRQTWTSLITEQQSLPTEIFFVDEGQILPFFLRSWHHRHRLLNQGRQTLIVDEITFQTPFLLTDLFVFPFLYLSFLYRKPIYRRFFKEGA